MHSYHWGMTASPLALDLWLTISGAGPHTPWADRRENLFKSVGPQGTRSDSNFERALRANLALAAKRLRDANRLADVISDRVNKRETRSLVRHLGPRLTKKRKKRRPPPSSKAAARVAAPAPAPIAATPPDTAPAETTPRTTTSALLFESQETSLYFDDDESALAPDAAAGFGFFHEAKWPRTLRVWRRLRGTLSEPPPSWLVPSDASLRSLPNLPKSLARAANKATGALRRDIARSSIDPFALDDGGDDTPRVT